MRQRQERTAERVLMCDCRSVRVDGSLRGRMLLVLSPLACGSCFVPARERRASEQPVEVIAHIGIALRILNQRGVVHIPRFPTPWIEHDLLPGLIGMKYCQKPFDRVVKNNR